MSIRWLLRLDRSLAEMERRARRREAAAVVVCIVAAVGLAVLLAALGAP